MHINFDYKKDQNFLTEVIASCIYRSKHTICKLVMQNCSVRNNLCCKNVYSIFDTRSQSTVTTLPLR